MRSSLHVFFGFKDSNIRGLIIGLDAIFLALIALMFPLTTRLAANSSVTLQADRVEWTDRRGVGHFVLNTELEGSELRSESSGFMFGKEGGDSWTITPALEDYAYVVGELKRRIGK